MISTSILDSFDYSTCSIHLAADTIVLSGAFPKSVRGFTVQYGDAVLRPFRVFPSRTRGEYTIMFKTRKVQIVGAINVLIQAPSTLSTIAVAVPFTLQAAGAPEVTMLWPSSVDVIGAQNLNIRLKNKPYDLSSIVVHFAGVSNVTVDTLPTNCKDSCVVRLVVPAFPEPYPEQEVQQVNLFVLLHTPSADFNLAGGSVWYKMPKVPEMREVIPESGLRTGGDEVTISVRDLGHSRGSSLDVRFGTAKAKVKRVLVATKSYVSAVVETPDMTAVIGQDVAIFVAWASKPLVSASAGFLLIEATQPMVTSVAPSAKGFVLSGTQRLSVAVVNLQSSSIKPSRSSDVTCSFSEATATVSSIVWRKSDDADELVINVIVPRVTSAGQITATVSLTDDPTVFGTFDFEFKALPTDMPSVMSASPTNGPLRGGGVVHVLIQGLVQVNSLQEVSVLFDAQAAEVIKVSSSVDSTSLSCLVPVGIQPGEISVSVTANMMPQAAATFSYSYDTKLPSVTMVVPSNGPLYGGTLVSVEAANLPSTSNIDDISVTFGAATAQVMKVRLVKQEGTLALHIQVKTPASPGSAPANVTATVLSRHQRTQVWSPVGAEFDFEYVPFAGTSQVDFVQYHSIGSLLEATLRISNFYPPSSPSDVTVTIGGASASILNMTVIQATTKLRIAAPAGSGAVGLLVNTAQSQASYNFTYPSTALHVAAVSPQKASGGRNVSLVCENLDASLSVAIRVGGLIVTAENVHVVDSTRVIFLLPSFGFQVSTMLQGSVTAGAHNSSFQISYQVKNTQMAITTVSPMQASLCGSVVTLYLSNVPSATAQLNASDVWIYWSNGSAAAAIESMTVDHTSAIIAAHTPVLADVTDVVPILSFPTLNLTFAFKFFSPPMPYVTQSFPAVASEGDNFVGVLKDLPLVTKAEDISVKFTTTSQQVYALVNSFAPRVVSGQQLTEIGLQMPALSSGQVTLSISTARCPNQQLQTLFTYVDRSAPYVASQSKFRGTSDGGTTFVVIVANIKDVPADELYVNFGPATGSVLSVFPATTAGELAVSVLSPKLEMGDDDTSVQNCELREISAAGGTGASFKWTFVKAGKPDIESVAPVRGSTMGGAVLELVLSSFPVVADDASIAVTFGEEKSVDVTLLYSNEQSTKLVIVTPKAAVDEPQAVPVSVYSLHDEAKRVSFDFIYDAAEMPSLTISPESGTVGSTITCTLSHSQKVPSLHDLDLQFGDFVITPSARLFGDAKTTVFTFVVSQASNTTGVVPISVASPLLGEVVATASFEITNSTRQTQSSVTELSQTFSVFPQPVSTSGGSILRVNLFNFTSVASASDVMVTLCGIQSEVQLASCVGVACTLDVVFPASCSTVGGRATGVITPNSDPLQAVTITLSTFKPCNYHPESLNCFAHVAVVQVIMKHTARLYLLVRQ